MQMLQQALPTRLPATLVAAARVNHNPALQWSHPKMMKTPSNGMNRVLQPRSLRGVRRGRVLAEREEEE